MIHELIDPKKKPNKSNTSRNTKTLQDAKNILEEINFEGSDNEHKQAESSSTTFIPPWLRNSLGLNQRTNLNLDWSVCLPNFTALGQTTPGSEPKSLKINQRAKESCPNDFEPFKTNIEGESYKKDIDYLPGDCSRQVNNTKSADNVENLDTKSDRTIPVYWNDKQKESESDFSLISANIKSLQKQDSKMSNSDVLTSAELDRLKEEDKKREKLFKEKNKLRKRLTSDQKQSDVLEMRTREALSNYLKKDVHSVSSEMRALEAKLLLLSAKSHDLNISKLNQQELRLLQEIKNQLRSGEKVERLFDHIKEINLRELLKSPDQSKNAPEKKDLEEGSPRQLIPKSNEDVKSTADKESVLSTDDENDIKRFSEFLSKNKNLDEKRKCLEEVRNYFERKRRTRLTKRRYVEDGKTKLSPEPESAKDKSKEAYRGRKSKFAICNEEIVEKAVVETLQKFMELYHLNVSSTVVGNMKKNILQAIASEPMDNGSRKLAETPTGAKKYNFDPLNLVGGEREKSETRTFPEGEVPEAINKESTFLKDPKKKCFKTVIETPDEMGIKLLNDADIIENERMAHLKREFDYFLNSIQAHIDISSLKLQSIILEKEERTPSSKNVQFVYNFTKKSLEPEKAECYQMFKEAIDFKKRKEVEAQTSPEIDLVKRNVKVQASEYKVILEKSFQTEDVVCPSQATQTSDIGLTVREIKELKSSDVTTGLYRMVKSKEAGKFYLYPEQMDDNKELDGNSNSAVARLTKKKDLVGLTSKEKAKDWRSSLREREKAKLKKSKRAFYAVSQLKNNSKEINAVKSGNSINCLYFRNLKKKRSGSSHSKKDESLAIENLDRRLEIGEELAIGDSMVNQKENHLGCFWFWNGEKISPGCDLKTHVEDLLKEKLKEMAAFEARQNEIVVKTLRLDEDGNNRENEDAHENVDNEEENLFRCSNGQKENSKENSKLIENESREERNKTQEKNISTDETENALATVSQEKSMKNVATQNSQQTFLSLNLPKLRLQSKTEMPVKRKYNKRHIVIKHGEKTMNLKKAEDIIRAVEELKKIRCELENRNKENNSRDSESFLEGSTSTSCSKIKGGETLSLVFGLKDDSESEKAANYDYKTKLKKLMRLMDRELLTNEACELEDVNSAENQTVGNQKQLDLIEKILCSANGKERENLWNVVRDFIKTKIGRDINDEGAREVCIEIEQDMPKNEHGSSKHSVLAKGHYTRNEGDVEVEIDLTLDDLGRILRQRKKRNRRRALYCSKSKKMSSSSIQSDFRKENLRRYQKYLQRFTALGGGFIPEKEMKAFLEK